MKAAEKLAERTLTYQYRRLINNFNKFVDDGKNTFIRIQAGLTEYTIERLILEGFTLTEIDSNGYKAYKISW